jgi:general secretion pathway protein D
MVTPLAFSVRRRAAPPSSYHAAVIWHNPSIAVAFLASMLLVGCYQPSVLPQSEGHITTPSTQAVGGEAPPPVRTSNFVPPPQPVIKQPTYSVVVNEVPVKELLFALARDTKQNIDIHPDLQGLVTINAVNETLPAILDRIARQVDLRYRIEGNTIVITPDTAYSKTYHIDYVNMTRNTISTIGVSGQISGSGSSQGASGGTSGSSAGGGTQSSGSSTSVTTTSTNDFWKTLEISVRGILSSSQQQTRSAQNKAERLELFKKEQDIRLEEAATARISADRQSASPTIGHAETAAPSGAQQSNLGSIFADDVIVNPIAGTVTITATEMQHNLIQAYLDEVQRTVQRQVMIEATIVEVTLSDQYQAGIDWSRLAINGGLNLTQSFLGATSSITNFSPGSLTVGYTNPTSRFGNISESIKLLNQFGNTRVLSSPKLMALNNQTALLKVVDNIVYFNITAQPAILISNTVGAQQSTFTTTAQTVPVGVVMSLTPQINENGQVTLSVRPTISRVLSFVNDPNPALAAAGVASPIPQIQTREMESVLQLVSGQTAVLGGLMQDNIQYTHNAVPGVGNIPGLRELFSSRNDSVTKSELVIFLRPTIITNPSLDSDELKSFQHFLPQQQAAPTEKLPGEITGKTP